MRVIIFTYNCVFCFLFFNVSWFSDLQFGLIYFDTWGSTQPCMAFLTPAFYSFFFNFSATHSTEFSYPARASVCCVLSQAFFRLALVKGHEVLFSCWPVTFQHVRLILPHLHNNRQKQTHVLSCHIRHWGSPFIQHIEVLLIISVCLLHQLLYSCKIEEHEFAQWQRVFVNVECLCLS